MAGAASLHIGIVLSEEKNKHKNRFNYIFVASAAVIALYVILLPFHFKRYWVLYQEYNNILPVSTLHLYVIQVAADSDIWLAVCVCVSIFVVDFFVSSIHWISLWTDVRLIDRTYYEKCIIKWNTIRLFWTNGQFSMPFISNSSRTKLVRYTMCLIHSYTQFNGLARVHLIRATWQQK